MNKLRARFDQSSPDRCGSALLPYITAGYPDIATTIDILERLDAGRCACVELGIPFSDPIADGPVIQTSFSRALEAGFRLEPLFEALGRSRARIDVPLVAMVSYSIVHRRGPQAFVSAAVDAGISGLIVPDLSIEEAAGLAGICTAHDCPLVMIAAPTTCAERRRQIAKTSEPFIYYQSLAGVTGERSRLPADLSENVARLASESGKPICVGFGISNAEQVADVCRVAAGAIVGSAIVRRINDAVERSAARDEIVEAVLDFVNDLTSQLAN